MKQIVIFPTAMTKLFRSTGAIALFLTFTCFETIRCTTLDVEGPNRCPRKIYQRGNATKLIVECCPDYFNQNGKCEACPAGKFGKDCLLPCIGNGDGALWHGVQCRDQCNCTVNQICDPVYGCVCKSGFYGSNCSNSCPSGRYGVNCKEECNCTYDAVCDPVTGDCLCPAGRFGDHCIQECPLGKFGMNCNRICDCSDDKTCDVKTGVCIPGNQESKCHQGFYDYNLSYNCSETCVCNDGATCNNHSGICECKDQTLCINIKKNQITKDINSTIYLNRNLFIVVVVLSVSLVCVLLLALTYLLCGRYLKHRLNQNNQNDGNETDIVHEHYNEINHYSEIRDDQLHDIRSSGMIESDHPQSRMQGTSNKEHRYQNNAQSLSNINMFEEQRPSLYCSLQHIDDDYLNPYCALRFERRVHSCMF